MQFYNHPSRSSAQTVISSECAKLTNVINVKVNGKSYLVSCNQEISYRELPESWHGRIQEISWTDTTHMDTIIETNQEKLKTASDSFHNWQI
jgi:hypothetical protein